MVLWSAQRIVSIIGLKNKCCEGCAVDCKITVYSTAIFTDIQTNAWQGVLSNYLKEEIYLRLAFAIPTISPIGTFP
jgi:hypothetical protein